MSKKKVSEINKTNVVYNLIERFDFQKVKNAMFENDWKWHIPETSNEMEFPSIKRMVASVTRKICTLLDDPKTTAIHSGGFRVERIKGEEGESISVSFVLETSETYLHE